MFTSLILITLIKRFFFPTVPGKRKIQKERTPERKRNPHSSHYRKILLNSQLVFCNNNVHVVRTDRFYSEILAFLQRVTNAIKM